MRITCLFEYLSPIDKTVWKELEGMALVDEVGHRLQALRFQETRVIPSASLSVSLFSFTSHGSKISFFIIQTINLDIYIMPADQDQQYEADQCSEGVRDPGVRPAVQKFNLNREADNESEESSQHSSSHRSPEDLGFRGSSAETSRNKNGEAHSQKKMFWD